MRTPVLFVFTGIMFAAYPALRPYSSEIGDSGAAAFASPLWVVAHTCAMLGFIALGLAMLSTTKRRDPDVSLLSTWIGVGLVLPYYGAETFALNAIGRSAVDGDLTLLELAEPIRYSLVPTIMFGSGLVLIAVGAVAFALRNRVATVFAAGFVLFLPQFYMPPALRIAHGVLILIGALLVARSVSESSRVSSPLGR